MRQTLSDHRPAARRGLGAVVLLVLLAFLHATFSPGPRHLSALDLDGCLQRRIVTTSTAQDCQRVPAAVLTAPDSGGHHHDGDASQSCDASAYGPRQLTAPVTLLAMPAGPATAGPSAMAPATSPDRTRSCAPGAATGSVVLRC